MGEMKVAVCILSIYRSTSGDFYTGYCIPLQEKAS